MSAEAARHRHLPDGDRLRERWIDVLTQTWLDGQHAVLSRTGQRVPMVARRHERQQRAMRDTTDFGAQVHYFGLLEAPTERGN